MFEEFYFDACGARLYCRRYGRGAPLIMVHGACTDCDFFHDTAEILAGHFCVFTYDRFGSGRSTETYAPPGSVPHESPSASACAAPDTAEEAAMNPHDVDVQGRQLAELASFVLTQTGDVPFLVGHSAGGVISMEALRAFPSRFRRILLYEPPSSCGSTRDPIYEEALQKTVDRIQRGRYAGALACFLPLIGEKDPRARENTPEELENLDRDCRCFIQHEFLNIFHYTPDAARLSGLNITVGIGEMNHAAGKDRRYLDLAAEIGAEVVWFPGTHNAPFDLPKEFAYLTVGILTG